MTKEIIRQKNMLQQEHHPDIFSEDDVPVLNQGKAGSCVAHAFM